MGSPSARSQPGDARPLEEALARLEANIDHAPTAFRAEAGELAVQADRAGCPELALIARMLATGVGKAGPRSLLALAHKALAARASLGRTPRLPERRPGRPATGAAMHAGRHTLSQQPLRR